MLNAQCLMHNAQCIMLNGKMLNARILDANSLIILR